MKKQSVLLLVLLICVTFVSCRSVPIETTTEKSKTTVSDTPRLTDETTINEQDQNIGINNRLISLVGQPLSYFTEEFGIQLDDLEMFYEGPPVGEYTIGETTYVFNNYLGYEGLTKDTPCTAINAKYTELLTDIEQGSLTEDRLIVFFGQPTGEYDNQIVYQYNGVNIQFKINADRIYDDFIRIYKNYTWE